MDEVLSVYRVYTLKMTPEEEKRLRKMFETNAELTESNAELLNKSLAERRAKRQNPASLLQDVQNGGVRKDKLRK